VCGVQLLVGGVAFVSEVFSISAQAAQNNLAATALRTFANRGEFCTLSLSERKKLMIDDGEMYRKTATYLSKPPSSQEMLLL